MAASTVPTANINALYVNTTGGTPADPAVMDNAIVDIVATINSNAGEQNANTAASVLPHADGSVTTPKLANEVVTTPKIAPLAITTEKIALAAVGVAQLSPGAQVNESVNNALIVALKADVVQRGINVKSAPYNAVGDGVTDDTLAIQAALDAAHAIGGTVYIPSGQFKITDTLVIETGVNVKGVATPHVWPANYIGSIIEYYGMGVAVKIFDSAYHSSNYCFENVLIRDMDGTGDAGLQVGDGSTYWVHDVNLNQITIIGFDIGFKIDKVYGITANLCKSRTARTNGWKFTAQSGGLTLSTFTSCGGYTSGGAGWLIERQINYSAFEQCYFDGCTTGFYMTGYTQCKGLFKNCGVENYTDYAFYLSNAQMIVGISSPVLVRLDATVVDNIYFSGVSLSLTNVYIPDAYTPVSGYDVNVASGKAICNDVTVLSLNGSYEGSYNFFSLHKLGRAENFGLTTVDAPSGSGAYTVDVRAKKNIRGSSASARRVTFSNASVGQVLTIYGYDDANKFFLDNFDLPKLARDLYIGKGDYVKLVYDDLDGTGNGWFVIELKLDRIGNAPTTNFWEVGRKFYYAAPTAGGKIGEVCVTAGTPGTWKPFGVIDA